MTDDGVAQAVAGELALLEPAVRTSPERTSAMLHPDFVEVGASGRRWTRAEIIAAMTAELLLTDDPVRVTDLRGVALAPDVVHVTYRTGRAGSAAHRSSVWRRTGDRWQLWYHQGTPVP